MNNVMEGYLRIKVKANKMNIFKSVEYEKAFLVINYLEAKIHMKIGWENKNWKKYKSYPFRDINICEILPSHKVAPLAPEYF